MDIDIKITLILVLILFVTVEALYLYVKHNKTGTDLHDTKCSKTIDYILDASRYNLNDMMRAYDMLKELDDLTFNKRTMSKTEYVKRLFNGKFKYIVDELKPTK